VVARPQRHSGFTYLAVLFAVAILCGGLAVAGDVWHTSVRREKEAELLHIGTELRKGIERYYLAGPRQFPRELADLLKDPRHPGVVRHLRRIYPDPITAAPDWGLVRAPDGGIAGVYSMSELQPLKTGGFRLPEQGFEQAQSYADWKFVYVPQPLRPPAAEKGTLVSTPR